MRPLTAVGVSLALCGCATVGANYAVPDHAAVNLPQAKGEFLGSANPAVSTDAPPSKWWRLYEDPVLDGLIEQALAANTDLRVAAANLEAARATTAEVESARDPHVGVGAAVARDKESGEEHLVDQSLPAETVGGAGLTVSYEIDVFGKLRRAIEASKANTEATEAALHLARVTLVASVTRAYVQACAAGRQRAVAEHAIELQAQSLEVTDSLFRTGRGVRTDVERARSQLNQLRAAPPSFAAQQQAALYTLALLLGRPPADYPRAVEGCQDIPLVRRPLPVGDGAALLARRPDIREAERHLAAATANVAVATAELYPTITLGASGGSSGLLADFGKPATQYFNFGPMLSWSIPDSGARARVRASQATSQAALARFDGVVLRALRETETNLSAYTHELERNDALRTARDSAASAAAETTAFYRAGRAPYLADLDAKRTLASADASLAASDAQRAVDQVDVFLALGGGW